MPLVTVRIDDELKQAMAKLKYLNWSAVIRETVEHKIKEEGSMNLAEAVLLNERLRKKAPEGWDSTSVIRAWRARRS